MARLRSLLVVDRRSIGAYVVALVVGLASLSIAGRSFASANQFVGFTRFHDNLNPATYFYPTASQVIRLADASAAPDKTLVIIGGSSIPYGWGQGSKEMWTDELQEQLGDEYVVLNLAMPNGAPGEYGAVAALNLLENGRSLVYLTDVYPSGGLDTDGEKYRYVFWDAWMKGLIPHEPTRDAILFAPSVRGPTVDAERQELRVRAALDSVLYFSDFWQTMAYRVAFTLWYPPFRTTGALGTFPKPRIGMPDPRPFIPREMRYPAQTDDQAMQQFRNAVDAVCQTQPDGSWKLRDDAPFWARYGPWLDTQFPGQLRERALLLVFADSPQYSRRVAREARTCWTSSLTQVTRKINERGFHAALIGENWTADDMIDIKHPSGAGGKKMARELAPVIRDLAGHAP